MPDLPPLARISAAIERLERLKAHSTDGTWQPGTWGIVSDFGQYVVEYSDLDTDDRDLIVTLHRTIDPVLDILRGAEEAERESGYFTTASFAGIQALALAEAILGGES